MVAQSISNALITFFDGDLSKALTWIHTSNPGLGGVTPAHMLATGKGEKLLEWIRQQQEHNTLAEANQGELRGEDYE